MTLDGWCVNGSKGSRGLCDSSCTGGGCLSEIGLQTEMEGIEAILLSVSKIARELYFKWVAERKKGRSGSQFASRVLQLHDALSARSGTRLTSTYIPAWAMPRYRGGSFNHLTQRHEDEYRAQVYLAQSEAALIELLVKVLKMYRDSIPNWFSRHNMAYGKGHRNFDPALVKPLNYRAYKGHTKFSPLTGPRSKYCRESVSKFTWSHGASEPSYLSCYRRTSDDVFTLAGNIRIQCVTCEVPDP